MATGYAGAYSRNLWSATLKRLNEAIASIKQYHNGVRYFRDFLTETKKKDITFPLRPEDWSQFLSHMRESGLADSTCSNYLNHVAYLEETAGFRRPDLKRLPIFGRQYKVLQKSVKGSKPSKQPITLQLGRRIVVNQDVTHRGSFIFSTLMLTGIMGLFRLGELTIKSHTNFDPRKVMRVRHFIPAGEYAIFWLPFEKTDPYGHGYPVYIPRCPDKRFCVVARVEHMIRSMRKKPDGPLFTWTNGRIITRDSFIRQLRKEIKKLGLNPKLYAGHSLRRGGAYTAKLHGLDEATIKMLGRWTSDAYRRYIAFQPPQILALEHEWISREENFSG